jgi:hypothetical protein
MENEKAVRLALYDLLKESELATSDQLPVTSNQSPVPSYQSPISWLVLGLAAFAWKSGYPLHQLNPAAPPDAHSPAGQVLKRTAHWLREQIIRSATDRDKLSRSLLFKGESTFIPTLDDLQQDQPIAPVPPHFRSPIPVRYPEVEREIVHIDADEPLPTDTAVIRNDPITITDEDLAPPERATGQSQPARMLPLRIDANQIQPAHSRTPSAFSPGSFTQDVSRKFGRNRERLVTTKLRIIVQEYPDGPGLYGLQVKVTCKGIRSYVAGTTNRDGRFLCELPVRAQTGLTYDVDITWPAELKGKTERKSITLNADRTEFTLPFFLRIQA